MAIDHARRSAQRRWRTVRARADRRLAAASEEGLESRYLSEMAGESEPTAEVPQQPSPPPRSPDELVPLTVRFAAAWSWRILLITAAVALIGWAAWQVRVVTFPILVAVLLAGLLAPTVWRLRAAGWRRGAAAGTVMGGFLVVVLGVLTVVGQQVGGQFTAVVDEAERGIDEIQNWLADGPLNLSQEQITELVDQVSAAVADNQDQVASGVLSTAGAAAEVLAGVAIALFALFFFLFDGRKIWTWVLSLVPSAVRADADRAGLLAFGTLTAYVRSTVLVATFDGVFVTIWLLILSVPLALPLGVLVFFGAFIPLVGAFVSGALAVLVAFVTQGPVVALLVLAGIVAIQQIEAHLFAPLVMGRMVKLHPLAIVVAISAGGVVFGIIGAIVAVPLVAVAHTVSKYLSERSASLAGDLAVARQGTAVATDGTGEPEPASDPVSETTAGPSDR